MIEAWSAARVGAAEEPLLAAGVPLMERAAFALVGIVRRDLARRRGAVRGARVALLVGPGNNGGDALFAGAYLARRGVGVTAYLAADRVHEPGLAALRAAGGRVVTLGTEPDDDAAGTTTPTCADAAAAVARCDVVVDGLLGIGATGALRGTAARLVEALNEALGEVLDDAPVGPLPGRDRVRPWVVAVDAPSGIGVDDGTLPGPVLPADRTVTFGVAKPGLLLPPAAHVAGALTVVDLGLEPAGPPAVARLEDDDVAARWVVPGPRDHKYTRGVVGVVAGTATYPGAAVLAASAAVQAGAGMVRYQGPDVVGRSVLAARPEVVTAGGRVQAWVLGPGLPATGGDDGQRERARAALAAASGWPAEAQRVLPAGSESAVPAVVDAGALALLDQPCPGWVVLTPHAGELATLLAARGEGVERADVEAEPLRWARRAHELTGATVLLKGAATVVVGPGATVFVQAEALAWAATAGSGDVLAGLLGAMLAARSVELVARPDRAAEVAAAAALVHGRAAHRATPGGPAPALAIAGALPATIAALLASPPTGAPVRRGGATRSRR
ncbi:YjeF-family domain protein [Xylanimonas cellulosilytica DSM 15894]|uniref:Bifunctional NAD(P)H-hydrate repair enzyme n=1 Tax=Xylanimonas cellulosilytica (strain DSM 15894 / JCM 12276 / CECT 5975 / KCTC 9989 / LMG 20990 / NBRC 107835 / XIL07) TaxID=446471 RepID=D1BWX7_XYLCX|nr:bifunctional ADP-dependent NAD(P)H-hydrate dehydratase/NAD(P)H-hydrate epimerase [Xylanimonas cellulosilytica]ACZ29709.1 YjeF-family domain protein [Xylanimonas cellulosilytica DSM 15894]